MTQEYAHSQFVEAAMRNWETILEEMEAMADAFDAEGWDTVVCHPGDVQLVSGESVQTVFDVLVPDDEYREVESVLTSDVSFDSYEVHSDVLDGVVHLIVVLEDSNTQTGLLYPAYYGVQDAATIEKASMDGDLRTHLRRLNGEYVELTHSEPELFAPPTD